MLKDTNLDGVKSVARMLLMTPIHKTPYSPAVVQHPFTATGFVVVFDKGGRTNVLDLTKKERNVERWQEFMKEKINSAKDLWDVYALLNKPYGLAFLKFVTPYLSSKDYAKLLADAWVRSENPNMDKNFTKKELLDLFKKAVPTYLMTKDEYQTWKNLEQTVTVYRGVTTYNGFDRKAMSWTLDEEKAKWFAERFGENGKVYSAEIDKKDVYACFGCRGESEVVVDPKRLQNITMVEEVEQVIKLTM